VAWRSAGVTSVMRSSRSSSISGQRSSAPRPRATKPSASRSRPAADSCSTHWATQWWLVSTRPSADTKEPEQPFDSRSEACIARCTQAVSGANP